jgi:hypothetical protein
MRFRDVQSQGHRRRAAAAGDAPSRDTSRPATPGERTRRKTAHLIVLAAIATLLPLRVNAAAALPNAPADTAAVYTEVVRSSCYVPGRDGTRLAMNLYRPAVNGAAVENPFPVVFVFTPYRARYRGDAGNVVETVDAPELGLRSLIGRRVTSGCPARGQWAGAPARRALSLVRSGTGIQTCSPSPAGNGPLPAYSRFAVRERLL